MMFIESYLMPANTANAEIRERGSRFLAFTFPVTNEDEAKKIIQELKKNHPKANHHCWALVLSPDASFQKCSDDREPSNTAGKPILRQIISKQISFCLVVVVRYFGGKLLGVPGLISAYGAAAEAALNETTFIQKTISETYRLTAPYAILNQVYTALNKFDARVAQDLSQGDQLILIFEINRKSADSLLKELKQNHLIQYTCA